MAVLAVEELTKSMCGIAGFRAFEAANAGGRDALEAMIQAIAHRGPDDHGAWLDDGVALGHRRLSILDLSPQGHQPMRSHSGRYVIVFNGEIYNFGEIRDALGPGIAWRGHSDTEIMLAAFERWGLLEGVRRLAGMFAFALWDTATGDLHFVRDRIGEKPLYVSRSNTILLFGSELKALRAHPSWKGTVDRGALALYLRHGYIPAPYTIYEHVRKVEPGTVLSVSADGTERVVRYWSLTDVAERGMAQPLVGSDPECLDQLEDVLRRVVGEQCVADVPLGAFLSGGVDSSTIVALMQAVSTGRVRTFTIGFREQEFDETSHARAVAAHLGTDHTELTATPADALALVPRLPTLYDEPFADSSQIPTFLLAQLTRAHVTVSLSGDGGDEGFGGYPRYWRAARLWSAMQWAPAAFREAAARPVRRRSVEWWSERLAGPLQVLPPRLRPAYPGQRLRAVADVLRLDSFEQVYHRLLSICPDPEEMVRDAREPPTVLTGRVQLPRTAGVFELGMAIDALSYLPDDIMVKVDRATMGVSLESRAPLLDHRVVELAWRLPRALLRRHPQGKWPLRQVLYRHVPKPLVERPKMGFGVPLAEWLRGPLRAWAEDLLAPDRLKREGYFQPAPVRAAWEAHISGAADRHPLLWHVLMFQAWLAAGA